MHILTSHLSCQHWHMPPQIPSETGTTPHNFQRSVAFQQRTEENKNENISTCRIKHIGLKNVRISIKNKDFFKSRHSQNSKVQRVFVLKKKPYYVVVEHQFHRLLSAIFDDPKFQFGLSYHKEGLHVVFVFQKLHSSQMSIRRRRNEVQPKKVQRSDNLFLWCRVFWKQGNCFFSGQTVQPYLGVGLEEQGLHRHFCLYEFFEKSADDFPGSSTHPVQQSYRILKQNVNKARDSLNF